MIKLETIRTFVAVAEAGNIRDAAERLRRTASAVSMSLKQLEQQVGGELFETDRKNMLTPLGAYLFEAGRIQVHNYDSTVARIQSYARSRIGRLTLASVPSVAANLIPALLPRFVQERPGIEIELLDMDSRNVRRFVELGQADLGIAGRSRSNAMVDFEPLFRDRFRVVCSAECTLARIEGPVPWDVLERENLILNGASEKINSPDYRALSRKATAQVRNVTSLLALAKADFGVTLLPALTAVNLPSGVVALDLADEDVWRVVGLHSRRQFAQSPVAAAFRLFVLDETPALLRNLGLQEVNS